MDTILFKKEYDVEGQWGGVDWAQICWTHSLPGFRIYLGTIEALQIYLHCVTLEAKKV